MPVHEERTLGVTIDLRGYDVDRFRGDLRAEYSPPSSNGASSPSAPSPSTTPATQAHLPPIRALTSAPASASTSTTSSSSSTSTSPAASKGHSPEIYFEVGLTDF